MQPIESAPIDLCCLARFTGGDAVLDAEILNLFAAQSADLVAQLETAADSRDATAWRRITHSLKGAARGVGALALAEAAATAEPVSLTEQPVQMAAALHLLKARSEAVILFVSQHLSGSPS